jgi:hypothetical protein
MRCNVHHVMDVDKIKELIPNSQSRGGTSKHGNQGRDRRNPGIVEINTKYDNQKIPTEEDI